MLNLLPPSEKNFLASERKRKLFIILSIELTVFLLALLLSFLIIMFYLMGQSVFQKATLDDMENTIKSTDFTQLKSDMAKYNAELSIVDAFYKTKKPVAFAVEALLSLEKPEGVIVQNIVLEQDLPAGGQPGIIKFKISGFAKTREKLLDFKKILEESPNVKGLDFPSSNWINPEDISFTANIQYGK